VTIENWIARTPTTTRSPPMTTFAAHPIPNGVARYSPATREDPEAWIFEPAGGPSLAVYRGAEDGQWRVLINTEDMHENDPATHDAAGCPYMLVSLNDGDVYEALGASPSTAGTPTEVPESL